MGQKLGIQEAARRIGIKPSELKRSRNRGLPPGNLGHVVGGVLVWDSDDLVAVRPAQLKELKVAELRELAEELGLELGSKATKAQIIEAITSSVEEE